jgi:WD40 repeat protein
MIPTALTPLKKPTKLFLTKVIAINFKKKRHTKTSNIFSPDSQWLITRDDNDNSKVWSVETGKYPDFLKDEKNIRYATFSQDSQWLITTDVNGNSKVWSVETGKYYDFLKDKKY